VVLELPSFGAFYDALGFHTARVRTRNVDILIGEKFFDEAVAVLVPLQYSLSTTRRARRGEQEVNCNDCGGKTERDGDKLRCVDCGAVRD